VVRETIPNVADDAVTSLLLGYSQLLGILLSLSFTEFLFHWLNSNTPSTDQPENEFSQATQRAEIQLYVRNMCVLVFTILYKFRPFVSFFLNAVSLSRRSCCLPLHAGLTVRTCVSTASNSALDFLAALYVNWFDAALNSALFA
jgi:hypothetical protein